MKKSITIFVFLFLIFFSKAFAIEKNSSPSISTILNPDGSLKSLYGNQFNGSYDVSGFKMRYTESGAPVFTPSPENENNTSVTVWGSLGTGLNNQGYSSAVIGNDFYVGGLFTTAGGITANYIAKWDGTSWSALGSGTNGLVRDLAVSGTDLYAAGYFTQAGGITVNYVAKWDGTSWSALGTGVGSVLDAIYVLNGNVYVGGNIHTAGGVSASSIAKWDGTSWSALGQGVNQDILRMASMGNDLYVVGVFTGSGATTVNRIAKWNGTTWSGLGTGANNVVRSICVVGSNIYVGGDFTTIGGISANHIAKWNGSSWSALGSGVDNTVYALLSVSNGDLYAGGGFNIAGGITVNHIAKWNGSAWSSLATGVDGSINSLQIIGNDIMAAGAFSSAGSTLMTYSGKWHDDALPVELSSFTSNINANNVKLNWSTVMEENNSGFDIERKLSNENYWNKIANVHGNGTSNNVHNYSYEDKFLASGKYNYRLEQIDFNGNYKYYDLSNEVVIGVPNKFKLSQNYPNPFNPSTIINYQLPNNSFVSIKIFDITGREVKELVNEMKQAGYYSVTFDAKNLSSGTYFYMLSGDNFSDTKKMLIVK